MVSLKGSDGQSLAEGLYFRQFVKKLELVSQYELVYGTHGTHWPIKNQEDEVE